MEDHGKLKPLELVGMSQVVPALLGTVGAGILGLGLVGMSQVVPALLGTVGTGILGLGLVGMSQVVPSTSWDCRDWDSRG